MYESKIFHLALLTSILAHSILFFTLPYMPFVPSKAVLDKIQITYYEIKKEPGRELEIKRRESVVTELPEIKKQEILKPPRSAAKKIKESPKQTAKDGSLKEKKFEKVIEEEKDDAKKAGYISYYRAVREKIKRYADVNYPRGKRLGEGEVFLSFAVASSGELLRVMVIDEKSAQNSILRNIAIESIRDASPFPPFPQGMSQYQITFNIIISFELSH